jgi:hypothetical protein
MKSVEPAPDTTANGAVSTPRQRRKHAAATTTPPEAPAGRAAAKPKSPRAKRATVVVDTLKDVVLVESTLTSPAPVINGQPSTPRSEAGASADVFRAVTDDDIRVRAYFLSLEHRGQGSPEYFWQLAERELRQRAGSR